MSTKRAEARKVANLVPVNIGVDDTHKIANAVSDYWEPDVERWRKHARNLAGVIDAMLVTGAFAPVHKEILDEVKEALSHD